MQQELNHVKLDQSIDVHAPAKTYYTTGSNSGNAINRLRTLSVSLNIRVTV